MGLFDGIRSVFMNKAAVHTQTFAPEAKLRDPDVVKTEIMQLLQQGTFRKQLKLNLQRELNNTLTFVNGNNFAAAVQHIDAIIVANRQNTFASKATEELKKIKSNMESVLVWQKTVTPTGAVPLFDGKDLISYVADLCKFSEMRKMSLFMHGVSTYINSCMQPADKLILLDNKTNGYVQYKALEKYFKYYFKDRVRIPKDFPWSYKPFVRKLEDLEKEYPLAKKITDKEQVVQGEIDKFVQRYVQYQYSQFYWHVMDFINENAELKVEQIIAKFIYAVTQVYHMQAKYVIEDFSAILDKTRKEKLRWEHLQKELRLFKEQQRSVPHPEQHKMVSRVITFEPAKKEVPSTLLAFADTIATRAPEVVQEDLQNYIIRVYRKNKPLSARHLIEHFGIEAIYMDRIKDVAESLGLQFISSSKNTTEAEKEAHSSEILQDALTTSDTKFQTVQTMHIPSTAQEIFAFLQKHNLRAINVKQLLKQIQDRLIEGDRNWYMKKKLVFALTNPKIGRHEKWGKYRAIELSRAYRLVVHGNNILHIVDHDQYDNELDFKK